MLIRLLGLLVLLGATSAQAVTPPLRISQFVLQMPDTVRSQMLTALARGDIQGAIALYQLETGRQAIPQWLRLFELAFSAENRRPGACIEVARRVSQAFQQLGGKPSFMRFTSQGSYYLGFETRAGDPLSTVQLSDQRLHVVVRMGDKIYDVFTGPQGLPVNEYLRRLVTEEGATINTTLIQTLEGL